MMSRSLINFDALVQQKLGGGLAPGTVRNLCSRGEIPFVRIGSRILFDEKEIRKLKTGPGSKTQRVFQRASGHRYDIRC